MVNLNCIKLLRPVSQKVNQLIRKKILYVYTTKISQGNALFATLPCNIRKSKNVTKFPRST